MRLFRRRDRQPRPVDGICHVRMRSPAAIDSYWECDLEQGHTGPHQDRFIQGTAQFTDGDAAVFNGRRASVAELDLVSHLWKPNEDGANAE